MSYLLGWGLVSTECHVPTYVTECHVRPVVRVTRGSGARGWHARTACLTHPRMTLGGTALIRKRGESFC